MVWRVSPGVGEEDIVGCGIEGDAREGEVEVDGGEVEVGRRGVG